MNSRRHGRARGRIVLLLLILQAAVCACADGERILSLADTVSLALQQNSSLKRSALQVDLGSNSVDSAKGEQHPNLNLSTSGSLTYSSEGDASIFDKDGGAFDDSLRASLSSSMIIYDGGSTRGSIAAAEASLEAVRNDYDRDRQALLLAAVNSHFLAVVRGKQVRIREEELANQMEQLERIRLDYRNGIRVRSEVLRQEALVAQGRGSLIEAKRQHAEALFSLKDLLQIAAGERITCEDTLGTQALDALSVPDLEESMALLGTRLDIEAQRARLEAAEYDLRVARAGRRPSLSANASLATGYSTSMDGGFPERFFSREPSASAGLVLNVPLFDRRRTQTGIVRSQIQLRQEELFYEDLLQVARTDLHRAFLDFESAGAQLSAAREQLASAEEALQAEAARYEAGVATLLDLNSIRSTRLDAAVAVEQAKTDLFTSRLAISFEDGSIETFLLDQLRGLDPAIMNSRQ